MLGAELVGPHVLGVAAITIKLHILNRHDLSAICADVSLDATAAGCILGEIYFLECDMVVILLNHMAGPIFADDGLSLREG